MPNSTGGISVANNLLANTALYNLNHNQMALGNLVKQLSSGLRVNTAADDPSGLAIAVNLQNQVNGFDTAVRNVQDATSAANVADGALSSVTDILQRTRSLAIEASRTYLGQDKSALQAEIHAALARNQPYRSEHELQELACWTLAIGFQPTASAAFIIVELERRFQRYPSADRSINTSANTMLTVPSNSSCESTLRSRPHRQLATSRTNTGSRVSVITLTAGTAAGRSTASQSPIRVPRRLTSGSPRSSRSPIHHGASGRRRRVQLIGATRRDDQVGLLSTGTSSCASRTSTWPPP